MCATTIDRLTGPLFCSTVCRTTYYQENPTGKRGKKPDSDVMKVSKALVFNKLNDPVRDVLREEVRATISQHVKDNVLGMTEALTDLLPLIYAAIARDVQSDDTFVRQKAIALAMKYIMPLGKEDVVADDSRIINVVHHVPIPDTNFGHAIEGELVALPPGVEAFEADWPTCDNCGERKHPDTGNFLVATHQRADGSERKDRVWRCDACTWRASIKAGNLNHLNDVDPITGQPYKD
jgi:hypothetical protein